MKKSDTSKKQELLLDFYNTPKRRLSEIKLEKGKDRERAVEFRADNNQADNDKIKVFALSSS